ncbi:endomucin [Emydura macquarii macquarii]|uniref:endomucin n=1 Tax=Emydura macquarii macquarii TaxID=1129001 RepID=UPI00352A2639
MPMGQTTSMKPLGAALLCLAVFSICTANGSSDSYSKVSSSTSISVTSDVTLEPVSQITSLQQSTEVTRSPPSITATSDETNSAGKAESPPGSSVTAASDSTWITTDLHNSKTTSGRSKDHETISNADGSPTSPTTRTSPAGTHAEATSSHPKSLSTSTIKSLGSSGSNDKRADNDHYSSIILPVVIALIVITLSVFILVALYRMCRRTTPERQENGAEQGPTDKEGVKLLSVKTTSPETGEHSSLGKNKTRQHDESSSHLGNKYM